MAKDYVTTERAAQLLNVSSRTIRNWAKNGKLRGALEIESLSKNRPTWAIPRKALEGLTRDSRGRKTPINEGE